MSIPNDPNHKLVDDFAIRSFRDVADGDYISARMACRAQLTVQYLWASQQAIEKYLKCILLLNRIPAKKVRHHLSAGLTAIKTSGTLALNLVKPTEEFIDYLDQYGQFRSLEVSNVAFGHDLLRLDRAVWELRRFCTLEPGPRALTLRDGQPAPKAHIPGGELEKIIANAKNPARAALLWQNAFFGRRVRRRVKLAGWCKASNSPLYLNPHIRDEILKYVYLPKDLKERYGALKTEPRKTLSVKVLSDMPVT
jgi:hypothetical protein